MKKNIKSIFTIQLFIASLFVGGYYIYIQNTQQKKVKKTSYFWLTKLENKYEKESLPKEFINLINSDLSKDSLSIKLVFRFSQLYCGACVNREVRLLREAAKKIGWMNIIFIATVPSKDDLNKFKNTNHIKANIYNVNNPYFSIDKEPIDTPFMFIIDSDFAFKELFISMKENEIRTEQYLHHITTKYF